MRKKYIFILVTIGFFLIGGGIIGCANRKKVTISSENTSLKESPFQGGQNNNSKKDVENLSITEINTAKRMRYRNNFDKYIIVHADTSTLNAVSISINNTTEYNLDKVSVKFQYLKIDGEIDTTATASFINVRAGTVRSEIAPLKIIKGAKFNCVIEKITSVELNFCYPSNNGSPEDQFFCLTPSPN